MVLQKVLSKGPSTMLILVEYSGPTSTITIFSLIALLYTQSYYSPQKGI